MITEPTVFILGAGASKPYGYPTAGELRDAIIDNFLPTYQKVVEERYGVKDTVNTNQYKKFKRLIEYFEKSDCKSIDLFLTRNKEFIDNGKFIIAFMIANYEIESSKISRSSYRQSDWYFELYNEALTDEIINPEELEKFFENNITFITFNYDRVLDYRLYNSVKFSFLNKTDLVPKIFEKYKPLHVYGSILPTDLIFNSSPKYGDEGVIGYIDENYSNISVSYNERSRIEEAQEIIAKSKRIFFLGFGFSKENMDIFNWDEILTEDHKIYGTVKGIAPKKKLEIKAYFSVNTSIKEDNIKLYDWDSVKLLKEHLL